VECGFGATLSQRIPDLVQHVVRTPKHVSACETEQPDIREQEPILAAIVLNQATAMCVAVVLKT
jgi:hypothetical protein